MNAVACFIAELFVFGIIVTLFVLGHYHHIWSVQNAKRHPANAETNTAH